MLEVALSDSTILDLLFDSLVVLLKVRNSCLHIDASEVVEAYLLIGRLFLDAGDGYDYRSGAYAYRKYTYDKGVLSSIALHSDERYTPSNGLERVELLVSAEAAAKIKKVTLTAGGQEAKALEFSYAAARQRLVVRAPNVGMAEDWSIAFE